MSTAQHTAAGQAAGYYYQVDRALLHLSCCPSGARVGIEVVDDVAVASASGGILLSEQDKHSISENVPFSDTGTDLWKTLSIWLKAIDEEEVDPASARFYLVTNKLRPDGLAKLIGKAGTPEELEACVAQVRKTGASVAKTARPFADAVLAWSDGELQDLIARIEFLDAEDGTTLSDLHDSVASAMHVPPSMDRRAVVEELLGWVHACAMDKWSKGEPAWIERDALDERYHTLSLQWKSSLPLTPSTSLEAVNTADLAPFADLMYVRQIGLLNLGAQEARFVSNSINDHNWSAQERTRLLHDGNLSPADVELFERRMVDAWDRISLFHCVELELESASYEQDACRLGVRVLRETLKHIERIAGKDVEEPYFCPGYYHSLSDRLKVGWHPNYQSMLES